MSLYSMTGFGRTSYKEGDYEITIEIKTLNSRFRDIKIKLSLNDGEIDFAVRKVATNAFSRGRIEITTKVIPNDLLNSTSENELQELAKITGESISLTHHLLFKIGSNLPKERRAISLDEAGKTRFMDALSVAIGKVSDSRKKEGEVMKETLVELIGNISSLVESSKAKAELVPQILKKRVNDKLKTLISEDIDKIALEREIAFMAEKADITEELVRLEGHISGFISLFSQKNPVGRKMEFLCQEIHREINTLGSKSQDFELSSIGVALKNELEKVREIAANIE